MSFVPGLSYRSPAVDGRLSTTQKLRPCLSLGWPKTLSCYAVQEYAATSPHLTEIFCRACHGPIHQHMTDYDVRAIYEYLRQFPGFRGTIQESPADRCQ